MRTRSSLEYTIPRRRNRRRSRQQQEAIPIVDKPFPMADDRPMASKLLASRGVAFDLLRDALSAVFGLSELKIGIKSQSYREPDTVMSDFDESGITYTAVSSPYEDLSDIGSSRADDHEFLKLPYMPEDPYAPPSLDYVPGPEHANDEIVAEDQPYAEDASPIAQSPDYVPESDPEANSEEDDDEDPEEDPIDYPADGGDDGDDEMDIEEDEDDDMDIEADKEDEDDEMDVEIDEEA
ncbi:hypothetical protein Tco_0162020 [Tanacetum coccineum]